MKLRIYTLMIVTFLSGVICGGAFTRFSIQRKINIVRTLPPDKIRMQILRILEGKLELTEEQKFRLTPILQTAQQDIIPLRKEVRGRVLSILENYTPQIESELTPKQIVKFQKLTEGFKNKLK